MIIIFRLTNIQQWQSVADRISELENQQQVTHDHNKQNYTYLDPSKTNRVSSSTLKAFQKNAVQSYFERQQQQQQSLRLSKTKVHVENDEIVKLRTNDQEKKCFNARPSNLSFSESFSSLPSSNTSQRSSLPNWHTDDSSMIAKPRVAMRNTNDVVKRNILNNTPKSILPEEQMNYLKDSNSSIHNTFTSFCEIKTEDQNTSNTITARNQNQMSDNKVNLNDPSPPPLPRKTCILRR